MFRTFSNCVGAVRAYADYWQFVHRYRSPFDDAPTAPLPAAAKARRIIAAAPPGEGGELSEHTSKKVLHAYGIPTTRDELCTTAARRCARRRRAADPS